MEAEGEGWPIVTTHLVFVCLAGLLLFWEDLSSRMPVRRSG